jgi:tetratricopeptide (TPR) repeat protein
MVEGEFALANEHLEAALPQPSMGWVSVGDHELYNLLVDAAAQQRDAAALQKYAPLAEEFASRYDHKLYRAVAHRAWGVSHRIAGRYTESQIRFDQAMEIFQQMNTRWQIGRTYVELGELALARADHTIAREYFSRALSEFETMGATADLALTRGKVELIS